MTNVLTLCSRRGITLAIKYSGTACHPYKSDHIYKKRGGLSKPKVARLRQMHLFINRSNKGVCPPTVSWHRQESSDAHGDLKCNSWNQITISEPITVVEHELLTLIFMRGLPDPASQDRGRTAVWSQGWWNLINIPWACIQKNHFLGCSGWYFPTLWGYLRLHGLKLHNLSKALWEYRGGRGAVYSSQSGT